MRKKIIAKFFTTLLITFVTVFNITGSAFADGSISLSPMTTKLILAPGETYHGSVTVFNQGSNSDAFEYKAEVRPFYVDEDYNSHYEEKNDYNQIVDWMVLSNETGIIAPNSGADIDYTITVPQNAPSGGQYAAIRVSNTIGDSKTDADGIGTNIKVSYGIAYNIFAEIIGTSNHRGEILEASMPSFLLGGNISASSSIKNTGNVHGTAYYKLQVFPLFSSEEVYTNEEDPDIKTILPDRTLYNETVWSDTPPVGIFNVVYTVEFEGVTQQVSKMVIICPIWLLFIIIFAIVALIIWLVLRAKNRGKSKARTASAE